MAEILLIDDDENLRPMGNIDSTGKFKVKTLYKGQIFEGAPEGKYKARIILGDPHRAVVNGPARLYGERMESPDIRAGMAMLIASLCAEGTSTIGNIGQIDRGYERIDERLRAVGAHIERTEIS